jgi:hypothetical protein
MDFENNEEYEQQLDDSWIHDFEKNDKPYNDFYKDNNFYVMIDFIYVNKENNIEKLNQEIFIMKDKNIISREEIIGIIKRNSIQNGNNYSLLSIIKYNVTLNPEDVYFFLETKEQDYNIRFFTILKHIDTIFFEKTINMFQDLNTLFIIFYEKDKVSLKNAMTNTNNSTKKIYLKKHTRNLKYNKTIRN